MFVMWFELLLFMEQYFCKTKLSAMRLIRYLVHQVPCICVSP
jgi:hypothetical protein